MNNLIQNCIVLGRLIILDCTPIHPIAYLTHRISGYVSPLLLPRSPLVPPTTNDPISRLRSKLIKNARALVAYWCEYPELFAAIADGQTEEERAYAVLKWFIVSGSLDLVV